MCFYFNSSLSSFLFIWPCKVIVAACGIFRWNTHAVVPWPGMQSKPPTLEAWSLNHWTTKEVCLYSWRISIMVVLPLSFWSSILFSLVICNLGWFPFFFICVLFQKYIPCSYLFTAVLVLLFAWYKWTIISIFLFSLPLFSELFCQHFIFTFVYFLWMFISDKSYFHWFLITFTHKFVRQLFWNVIVEGCISFPLHILSSLMFLAFLSITFHKFYVGSFVIFFFLTFEMQGYFVEAGYLLKDGLSETKDSGQ